MAELVTISQAKNIRSGINIRATVDSKSDIRSVNLKTGGSVNVCDIHLYDDTGEITLILSGEDIDMVRIGDLIEITNGYTNIFKGDITLAKGKFGQMRTLSGGNVQNRQRKGQYLINKVRSEFDYTHGMTNAEEKALIEQIIFNMPNDKFDKIMAGYNKHL